jgi:hypothetical protein
MIAIGSNATDALLENTRIPLRSTADGPLVSDAVEKVLVIFGEQ